jgi:hypothetical protein
VDGAARCSHLLDQSVNDSRHDLELLPTGQTRAGHPENGHSPVFEGYLVARLCLLVVGDPYGLGGAKPRDEFLIINIVSTVSLSDGLYLEAEQTQGLSDRRTQVIVNQEPTASLMLLRGTSPTR